VLRADNGIFSVSFFYLLSPVLAFGQWRRFGEILRHYLMPLYYYKHDGTNENDHHWQFSLFWFLAPQLALVQMISSASEKRASIAALLHYVCHQGCISMRSPFKGVSRGKALIVFVTP